MQDRYIDFLRGMFKGTEPTRFIALAFLTGILPIKKLKTQSALNNFDEFTMLSSGDFVSYIGFTEAEVKTLTEKYNQDYEKKIMGGTNHGTFLFYPTRADRVEC